MIWRLRLFLTELAKAVPYSSYAIEKIADTGRLQLLAELAYMAVDCPVQSISFRKTSIDDLAPFTARDFAQAIAGIES